jgi:hypothetical protein
MNTKDIGDITQAKLELKLLLQGYVVLTPRGDNLRYDFVIERNGNFDRVQCKTGRYRKGCVVFDTRSSSWHRDGKKEPYNKYQIDFFGVYCPQLDSYYLIPVEDIGDKYQCNLRVDEPRKKNNRYIWAKNYILV